MLGSNRCFLAFFIFNLNRSFGFQSPITVDNFNLILFKKKLNPLAHSSCHFATTFNHGLEVGLYFTRNTDAIIGSMLGVVKSLHALQQ